MVGLDLRELRRRDGRGGEGRNGLWRVIECDRYADVNGSFGAGIAVCGGRVGEWGDCGFWM